MFPIDLFLTSYGYSNSSRNSLEFAKKHQEKLIEAIRIDKFSRGADSGQILGEHIFYWIFSDQNILGRLLVLGCGATSGYRGSGTIDFKTLMDWLTTNKIGISYYSVHSYEESLKLWGTEPHNQDLPSSQGAHRKHGPSAWDYGDRFIQQSQTIDIEEFQSIGRDFHGTEQKLYFNTLEFLLKHLKQGYFLSSI